MSAMSSCPSVRLLKPFQVHSGFASSVCEASSRHLGLRVGACKFALLSKFFPLLRAVGQSSDTLNTANALRVARVLRVLRTVSCPVVQEDCPKLLMLTLPISYLGTDLPRWT